MYQYNLGLQMLGRWCSGHYLIKPTSKILKRLIQGSKSQVKRESFCLPYTSLQLCLWGSICSSQWWITHSNTLRWVHEKYLRKSKLSGCTVNELYHFCSHAIVGGAYRVSLTKAFPSQAVEVFLLYFVCRSTFWVALPEIWDMIWPRLRSTMGIVIARNGPFPL